MGITPSKPAVRQAPIGQLEERLLDNVGEPLWQGHHRGVGSSLGSGGLDAVRVDSMSQLLQVVPALPKLP